jgi:hypothetical protein
MKKHINLWLVMFLAISLALPIYSMAQTAPTLTLESYTTGDRIKGAPIKSFALGADGNLVVYLDGPFNFASLIPDIIVDGTTYSGCTVSPPASVSATQGATLIFRINSTTPGASFSGGVESKPGLVVDPEPGAATSFAITTATGPNTATGIFTWTTGGGTAPVPVGAYLAVFQAQATDTSGTHTSHLIVMININPPGYTLTVNTTNGSVTKIPDQPTYTISPVQTVQLTPTPASGYYFSGWSGDLSGTANPGSIQMNGSKTVTATFTLTPPTQCIYTYSDWTPSVCPSSGLQTRTVTSSSPAGCTGTPILTQSCTYTPPYTPPVGETLGWGLSNYYISGPAGTTRTFTINVAPGKTYGTISIYCLDTNSDFSFKFTPMPGYKYCGFSPYIGSIAYGMMSLQFDNKLITPRTSDGSIPPGNYTFEITFNTSGRISISSTIY